MAINYNTIADNALNNNSYQQQSNLTLNDVQSLMSSPKIIGQIVKRYEDALQFNVGFNNNIYIFINPYARQIYMKYVDITTGKDNIHVFQSTELSPMEQFSKIYNSTNYNTKSNDINTEQTENTLKQYTESLNLINSKLDKFLKLEPEIKKIVKELGIGEKEDAKQ